MDMGFLVMVVGDEEIAVSATSTRWLLQKCKNNISRRRAESMPIVGSRLRMNAFDPHGGECIDHQQHPNPTSIRDSHNQEANLCCKRKI